MTHDDALPALPIGEAEVLWHEPDPVMPERPGKIIDASHAFMDAAPLGTRLYSAEQMRAYARQAVALWKLSAMAQEDERAALAAREGEPVGEIVELGSRAEPKSDALVSANRAKVDAEQGWRRECDDTDAVLRLIGLDPEQCRTDGGSLNVPKIGSLLRDRATALAYLCPAGCGCTWRDNGDGSMSLYGPSSRSCAVCETMPLSKLLPLFAAPPALREAARLALEALENCSSEHGHRCNRCDSEVDEGGTIADALRAALAAEQPQPVCPHIRSSGVGDHATHWCSLNGPPAVPEPSRTLTQDERDVFDAAERRSTKVVVPEPSEAQVEAAWRAIPASHEDSRVSVITKGDVWVMLRAAAAARGR